MIQHRIATHQIDLPFTSVEPEVTLQMTAGFDSLVFVRIENVRGICGGADMYRVMGPRNDLRRYVVTAYDIGASFDEMEETLKEIVAIEL